MNRSRQTVGALAILAAGVAMLGAATAVEPEVATTQPIPLLSALSYAAMCRTGDPIRPDPPWMRQSYENDHCSLPPEPPVLDGTKASRDQLMAGLEAAKRFAASADRYHQCLSDALSQRRQEAERSGQRLNIAFITIETHRIVAGEATKKKVRDQIAMAVDDFNAEGSECPQ